MKVEETVAEPDSEDEELPEPNEADVMTGPGEMGRVNAADPIPLAMDVVVLEGLCSGGLGGSVGVMVASSSLVGMEPKVKLLLPVLARGRLGLVELPFSCPFAFRK